jgi:hypothetical protein
MIVKILTLTRIKGAKTKGVGRGEEERTNPYKNYTSPPTRILESTSKKGKRWQEHGKIEHTTVLP